MEKSVQRRLDSLSRHLLLLPPETNRALFPVVLRNEYAEQEEEGNPVVIGGMVLDIHATPSSTPYPRSTNPGKVHHALGGVARNIAECMSKLGTRPHMISALGTDYAGDLLLEQWKSSGLPIEGIRRSQDIKTPTICILFGSDGELIAGVASVEAIEKFLNPEWILRSKHNICSAPILMVDANLNPPALETSCQVAAEAGIPVWFEPVSVAKSRRIASVAQYVTLASPNEDELIAMANALSCGDIFYPIQKDNSTAISIESLFQTLKPAISVVLEKGVKIVVLTVGANGLFLCSRGSNFMRLSLERTKTYGLSRHIYEMLVSSCPSSQFSGALRSDGCSDLFAVHFPALPASVVRLTGAGDCLVAGILAALCSGLDLMQSVALGISVAKAAVEAETNVPVAFNLAAIAEEARLVYSAGKVLSHR